jgi:hypothetical protein
MNEPASPSPHAATGVGSRSVLPSSERTWFSTRAGRRYGWELGLIIAAKLVLLVALWLVLIGLWPRPATPPAAVVQQIYLPAASAVRHD